jgi:hypothetical protein
MSVAQGWRWNPGAGYAAANRIEPLLSIMTMVDGGLDMNLYALILDESGTFQGGGKTFYFRRVIGSQENRSQSR